MKVRNHHAAPGPAKHLISAIHYAPERSGDVDSVECSCGWDTVAGSHLELDDKWRAHRRAVGAPNRVFSDTIRDAAGTDSLRRPRRRKPSVGASVAPEYWPSY